MLFSTPTVHAWLPDREAINPANPTATPHLNLIDLTSLFYSHISHSCDQLLFLWACFVSHSVYEVIINPLIAWCHFAIAGSDGKRVLKTMIFKYALGFFFPPSVFISVFFVEVYFREAALPLGWTMPGWEIYFSLNKTHWLQKHRAKSQITSIHSSESWLISIHRDKKAVF